MKSPKPKSGPIQVDFRLTLDEFKALDNMIDMLWDTLDDTEKKEAVFFESAVKKAAILRKAIGNVKPGPTP